MSNDLTQQVSMVASGKATKTNNFPIAWIVDGIRCGRYKPEIERIRSAVANGDEAQAKSLKLALPAILWSGQFKRRKAADLIQHSGLLVADFDRLGDNLHSVRSKLLDSPHLLLLFISPSGNGLKAVFRVSSDAAQHGESFNAVAHHVSQLTGEKIDPSGKDVSRMCFVSYDPEIVVKSATPLFPTSSIAQQWVKGQTPKCSTDAQTYRLTDAQTHRTHMSLNDALPWVEGFLPDGAHQTNAIFFKMARRLLMVERESGRPLSLGELRDEFSHWFDSSNQEFLSESKEEYFAELCRIRSYTLKALDESPLELAWQLAKSSPLPPETDGLPEKCRRLASLCLQLQLLAGEKPFFLSSHSAASLLAVAPAQAFRWLKALEGCHLLKCVKRGDATKRLASEYHYVVVSDTAPSATKGQEMEVL